MSKLTLLTAASLSTLSLSAQTAQRPNIILFLVDDMGWQETSVPFWKERSPLNDRYRTPNMERLAQMGVKFTQAYACAVSSPSRCSLISGMSAPRHRVTNWTLRYNENTDAPTNDFTPPVWNVNGVQPDTVRSARNLYRSTPITSLPQLLRNNGYYTVHCGKAHFGAMGTPGEDPTALGFTVNIAGGANGAPASYLAEADYGKGDFHVKGLEKYYDKGTFLTEALTLEALQALEKPIQAGQPFFLYMAHYAIHVPYDADKRFTPNYKDADGQGRYDSFLGERLNTQEINHAALIEGMDKSLGDIMDYLQKRPEVAQNTIILFMSDNGGQAVSVRQGKPNFHQNYPARAGKGSALEGGVHEPMMVYWPGVTRGGTINENRVMVEDFFPSILEMAGVKSYRTKQTVDGKSFVPLLRHPSRHQERDVVWHYPHLWGEAVSEVDGYGPSSSIMHGPWHLIYYWRTGKTELYRPMEDISETNDLAQQYPKMAKKLRRRLFSQLKKMKAQMPQKAVGLATMND